MIKKRIFVSKSRLELESNGIKEWQIDANFVNSKANSLLTLELYRIEKK